MCPMFLHYHRRVCSVPQCLSELMSSCYRVPSHTRHLVTFDHSHLQLSTIAVAVFLQNALRISLRNALRGKPELDSDTHLHIALARGRSCFSVHHQQHRLQTKQNAKKKQKKSLSFAPKLLCCEVKVQKYFVIRDFRGKGFILLFKHLNVLFLILYDFTFYIYIADTSVKD